LYCNADIRDGVPECVANFGKVVYTAVFHALSLRSWITARAFLQFYSFCIYRTPLLLLQ